MLSNTCKTAVKAVIFLATKIESGDKVNIPGKLTTPFRGKLTRHLPGERVQRVL